MVTRTYYLSAVAGPWDTMHTGTLPLEQLSVWSVVEQTIEVTPDGGRVSSRVLLSSLMLDEARGQLSHLLRAAATPAPFSAVRLGDDPSTLPPSGVAGQAVDTCLIIHTCTALPPPLRYEGKRAARRKCHRHHPEE
jgi:hypothetical protein